MGAQVIYTARIIKESKQPKEFSIDVVPRPSESDKGDLINYFSMLAGWNSYHSLCIDKVATCSVNLGFTVVEGKEGQVVDQLAVVNDQGESFQDVVNAMALDFESTANGYIEVVKARGGRVGEIYFCPSVQTYLRTRGSNTAFLYRSPQGGDVQFHRFNADKLEDNSLIHFKKANQVSRYYGVPAWRGVVQDIELDYYSNMYCQKFFINSGVPDLAIIVEGGKFDDDTEKKVVEFIRQNFKGVGNAHKTLYLPLDAEGVKVRFEKLAPNNQWAYPLEKMRDSCRDRILSAHGVPPRLAGIVTAGQLGGGGEAEGQISMFQEVTISPRQRYYEHKLNALIKAMGINGAIKFDSIDTSPSEKPSEYYPRMVEAGIITVDEARDELGYIEMTDDQRQNAQRTGDQAVIRSLGKIRKQLANAG